MSQGQAFKELGYWGIFAIIFGVFNLLIVGGAVGGALAGAIAYGVYAALPVDDHGQRLPAWMSLFLLAVGIAIIVLSYVALAQNQ